MTICRVPMCVALAAPNSVFCTIHSSYTRREHESAFIHYYACGALIRKGQSWVVRAEGAFHARATCLKLPPTDYTIPTLPAAAGHEAHHA